MSTFKVNKVSSIDYSKLKLTKDNNYNNQKNSQGKTGNFEELLNIEISELKNNLDAINNYPNRIRK